MIAIHYNLIGSLGLRRPNEPKQPIALRLGDAGLDSVAAVRFFSYEQ